MISDSDSSNKVRSRFVPISADIDEENGGSVIPPCNFQFNNLKDPIDTGHSSDFPSRARAHLRAPAQEKDLPRCSSCQLWTADIDNPLTQCDKGFGYCRKLDRNVYGASLACPDFDDVEVW